MRGNADGDRRFRIDEHEAWRPQETATEEETAGPAILVDAAPKPPKARSPWRKALLALAILIPVAGLLVLGAYNGILLASNACRDALYFETDDPEPRCGLSGNRCVMRPDAAALGRERVCTFPSDGTIHLAFRLVGGGLAYVSLDDPGGENIYNAAHPGSVAPPADPYELVQRNLRGDEGVWTVRIRWDEAPADPGASMIIAWG